MRYLRLLAVGAASLLFVAACNNTGDTPEVAVEKTANTLFDYVPADTPYLAGNLQPTPDEVIDVFLQRFQPILESVQKELGKTRQKLEEKAAAHDDDDLRLANAVLQEFDGKLNRQGMESLGFDLRSHKVVYGMGVFPVIRIGLSDAAALRATIQRVLDRAKINSPELEYQGISYWRLAESDSADEPIGIYITILPDHLAVSIFPPVAEAQLLPAFLGLEMPSDSDAASRLAALNAEHGYSSFGSGILDLDRMVEEFISPDSIIAQIAAANGAFDPTSMTAECKAEIRGIVSNAPRMTVGVRELTASAVAIQYRIETKTTLAQQLAGLVANIPAANPLSKRILEFSFGLRLGAVRDFLRAKAAAIMENPYQCEQLQAINQGATEAYTQLNQPMPPLVNNLRGLRLSLSEITESESMPVNGKGLIAVHVDKPEMFVGMAQMFVPDLSELALAAGEPPVQLPSTLIPIPNMVAFAALSDEAIGLSIGEGEQDSLLEFLKEEAGPKGTFISFGYDMTAYMDYVQKLGNRYVSAADDSSGYDAEHEAVHQSMEDFGTTVQQAIKAFSDRSYTSFKFTPEGFEADTRVTFK